MKHFLLCTDLDRTLIPNGSHPESPSARKLFKAITARPEICLAYVTGRHRALIEEAIIEFSLPQPDLVIADVGTTIYRIDAGNWQPWQPWHTLIAQSWGKLSAADLQNSLRHFPELRLQEKEKQSRYKLSFYVDLLTNAQDLIRAIHEHLRQLSVQVNLIWSIDELAEIGLLDVLPAGAGKLQSIGFVMQEENFLIRDTVFAGDSGNDLDVLCSDIPSVLVANADGDIRALVNTTNNSTLYLAKGGYLGMNGNYSAGILEGMAHFWPETDAWLNELLLRGK